MKEILFSDSDGHEHIGKNARRMMAHLSISADEDVQQTLACFEKVRIRTFPCLFGFVVEALVSGNVLLSCVFTVIVSCPHVD